MSLIPSTLRADPQVITGRTMRELATPGRVTVGLAYVGPLAGMVSVGGVAQATLANAPGAVAVTRLQNRGGRIFGVPCRGVGAVQSAPPPTGFSVDLGARPNAAIGVYRTGTFTAPVTGTMTLTGGPDNYLTLNGAIVLSYGEGAPRQYYSQQVTAGQVFNWAAVNTGGFAGGHFTVTFSGGNAWTPDWRPAVAALQWIETGLPWWGTIEAGARAGRWVRRSVWDSGRLVRFEAGAGTERAVGVTESGVRVSAADFGSADFLAEDWLFDEAGEPEPVDVTDWVFSGSLTAVGQRVAFSVGAGGGSGGGGGGGTGQQCSLTVTGVVRQAIITGAINFQQWLIHGLPAVEGAMAGYHRNAVLDATADGVVRVGGMAACRNYYRALIEQNWQGGPLPGGGGTPDPEAAEPGSGTSPTAPASGDFVLVSKNGRQVWEPVKDV